MHTIPAGRLARERKARSRNAALRCGLALLGALLLTGSAPRAQTTRAQTTRDGTAAPVAEPPRDPLRGFNLGLSFGRQGIDDEEASTELGFELRFPETPWVLRPALGYLRTDDEARYAYGGLRADLRVSDRLILTPAGSVGYYERGSGIDLGSHVMFRIGFDVAYRINDSMLIGVGLHHLSNARIESRNPGIESLLLSWTWAPRW